MNYHEARVRLFQLRQAYRELTKVRQTLDRYGLDSRDLAGALLRLEGTRMSIDVPCVVCDNTTPSTYCVVDDSNHMPVTSLCSECSARIEEDA